MNLTVEKIIFRAKFRSKVPWVLGKRPHCDSLISAGRERQLQFKFLVSSKNLIVGQYLVPNRDHEWPTIYDQYVGIIRLDNKFCDGKLMKAIADGSVGITVGDRVYGAYVMESILG